jgi:DNA-binding response OmpR family regulator
MSQNILVADDEAPIRNLLSTYLKQQGYQVTTAANAEDLFNKADQSPFDLIILDIELGSDNGLEVLGTLKSKHPTLPILMLTGLGFAEPLLQEARRQGASGYVTKGLSLDHLLREIHRILKPEKP